MMKRIYLAARYSRFPEMQKYRAELERAGFVVTSRWINGGHQMDSAGMSTEAGALQRTQFALEDYEDLREADCVISFTERPRELSNSRGGRHVEHGMAIALAKRVLVVGFRENVFHCLPQVEFFSEWADALRALVG
jgi:nucleoside 2-deoxyribosyltransferase